MRRQVFPVAILATALTGCAGDNPADTSQAMAPAPVDTHTSQNSLDWSGAYEGILACPDCPGTQTRLTLRRDGGFELLSRPLVRGAAAVNSTGQFTWQPDGNSIALDATAGAQRFAVGEGRLILLNSDGSRPEAAGAALTQLAPVQPGARTGLAEVLEDHRWTLTSATGGGNQRIDALFPSAGRPFVFGFAGGRLNVDGGCNGLRGGYQVSGEGQLSVGRLAATMMACEAPLMAADAALSKLLAAPLELVIVQGQEPVLAMLAGSGEVLLLAGQKTPEARYGPPSTVFLEIGPRRLPCDDPASADGLCLQAREISFDQQGLRVGTPGEFQPFVAPIEGYTHVAGTRNVIRVKRFQAGGAEGASSAAVYVLDLVVESQVVPQ
jgi:heat shock protein HslJ